MTVLERRRHWNEAYASKGEAGVSWFEARPTVSLDLIARHGAGAGSLIDIGGGASRLVDELLDGGMIRDLAVLDLSPQALDAARKRLGARADSVEWIAADVTRWAPDRTYDIWHDRAAFHFLTEPADRAAYVQRLEKALPADGLAIIATFAPDGPERCSGLPVVRYDAPMLADTIGPLFELVDEVRHRHTTPWGTEQSFQFCVLRRHG